MLSFAEAIAEAVGRDYKEDFELGVAMFVDSEIRLFILQPVGL